MTRKGDYTRDEWALLTHAVELVELSMLAASRSGPIGKLRELTALSICLTPRAVPIQFQRNELVLSLLRENRMQDVGPFAFLARGDIGGLVVAIATARKQALTCCEHVAVLLAAKAPYAEADGFKRWLLYVARTIAEASGDRWLGLGRKLSDKEVNMLHQLATALQTSLVAPVPTPTELEAMLGLAPAEADGVTGGGDTYEHQHGSNP